MTPALERRADLLVRLNGYVPGTFAALLGLRFVEADLDYVVAEMHAETNHITRPGVVHGGILMAIAEGLEWTLAARFAKKYGGSRRAGWGAVIGGMVGAFMGVPIPIVGSIVGAFAGALVGALVFEMSRGSGGGTATKVAWGALIGRVTAAAVKIAIGFVMAVWLIAAAIM